MAIISGHGATLGFGTTTTFSPAYTSIGGFEASRESLDTSHLGTGGARTKIGGDLFDVGPFSSSFFFDPQLTATTEGNSVDDLLFDSGEVSASETVTITYPGAGTGKTCAGSAHVTGFAIEELATDTLLMANITIQFDDWPTFDDGT